MTIGSGSGTRALHRQEPAQPCLGAVSLRQCAGTRFLLPAARGAEPASPAHQPAAAAGVALRSHRLLRAQAPPLPPPPRSRPPAQSAARGPTEPGRLSVWRRLSATQASRGARRPATSATPGTRLFPAQPPLPLLCRGRSGPRRPGRDSPPLPPGGEGTKKAERLLRESASRGPGHRGSGLEEAEAEGSARHCPVESFHLQAEAAATSCVKAAATAAASGAGTPGAPWPWRGDPDPRTPGAQLGFFGPLRRHLDSPTLSGGGEGKIRLDTLPPAPPPWLSQGHRSGSLAPSLFLEAWPALALGISAEMENILKSPQLPPPVRLLLRSLLWLGVTRLPRIGLH